MSGRKRRNGNGAETPAPPPPAPAPAGPPEPQLCSPEAIEGMWELAQRAGATADAEAREAADAEFNRDQHRKTLNMLLEQKEQLERQIAKETEQLTTADSAASRHRANEDRARRQADHLAGTVHYQSHRMGLHSPVQRPPSAAEAAAVRAVAPPPGGTSLPEPRPAAAMALGSDELLDRIARAHDEQAAAEGIPPGGAP